MDHNQMRGVEACVGESRNSFEEMEQSKRRDEEIAGENQNIVEIGETQETADSHGIQKDSPCLWSFGDFQNELEMFWEYESNGEKSFEEQTSNDDDEWVGEKRCLLSDPTQPHYLFRRKGEKTNQKCCSCGERFIPSFEELFDDKKYHYYCAICQVEFHYWCREYQSKIIHPYHPQHPLTFTFLNQETGMIVDTEYREYFKCFFSSMPIGFHKTSKAQSSYSLIFDKCTWCAKDLGQWFYRCGICNFSLDLDCIIRNPPITIPNPKNHHHPLSLFPRPASFPCNACGLIDVVDPSYACYQCNYVVHQSCVDLPRVIKITRHPHRISHTPYLKTMVSTCRVCYKNVDIKYGQYSCYQGDCSFVVHSKCATHKRVWDGVELEWEPEEAEDIIAPYKEVDGLIEHFSHQHHYLKLGKYDGRKDSGKKCQACMCSILSSPDEFYSCITCEFFLHEVCANLPRNLDHGLHNHSLFLNPYPLLYGSSLDCFGCNRMSSCWKYKCERQGCIDIKFQLDVNCILVPECFTHGSHAEHLLFMSTIYIYENETCCQGCKMKIDSSGLQCTVCEFTLCYRCTTIPDRLYYKYDEHPLSLCYGESGVVDGKYWCEVCEKRLDPKEWFYTNRECCSTIHVECVFGDYAFVKSGHTFEHEGHKVEAVSNNNSSRPACRKCQHRCLHPVYFKAYDTDDTAFILCSSLCLILWFLGDRTRSILL